MYSKNFYGVSPKMFSFLPPPKLNYFTLYKLDLSHYVGANCHAHLMKYLISSNKRCPLINAAL